MYQRRDVAYAVGDQVAPSNLSKEQVEEYARKVAAAAGFESGDHPAGVAELFGGRVQYVELEQLLAESGSVLVHRPKDFDILLPRYTSPTRDRFTIAHELGHYFLHSRQGQVPIIVNRSGSNRLEWEANWFAASLLMPAAEFAALMKQGLTDSQLAARFGVSFDAARIRRGSLGG